jgi:hypothetical protein
MEPLKRYGIIMSDANVKAWAYKNGVAAAGAELTDQQKVVARYGYFMERTNRYAGDFKKTQDQAANAMRTARANYKQAQAELGTELLPALAGAAKAATWLIHAFKGLPQPLKYAAVALAGFVLFAPRIAAMRASLRGMPDYFRRIGTQATLAGEEAVVMGNQTEKAATKGGAAVGKTTSKVGKLRAGLNGATGQAIALGGALIAIQGGIDALSKAGDTADMISDVDMGNWQGLYGLSLGSQQLIDSTFGTNLMGDEKALHARLAKDQAVTDRGNLMMMRAYGMESDPLTAFRKQHGRMPTYRERYKYYEAAGGDAKFGGMVINGVTIHANTPREFERQARRIASKKHLSGR